MPDATVLVDAFRALRTAWFNAHLASHSHEREWESESRGARREKDNAELRQEFDEQTEQIITGYVVLGAGCSSVSRGYAERTKSETPAIRARTASVTISERHEGQPDEKVRESLGRLESACRGEPDRASCDICALIDAYRTKEPLGSQWHSVDEPPPAGTWCWVVAGADILGNSCAAIWLARRTSCGEWGLIDEGEITLTMPLMVLHGVTAWQPANVPDPPENEESSDA